MIFHFTCMTFPLHVHDLFNLYTYCIITYKWEYTHWCVIFPIQESKNLLCLHELSLFYIWSNTIRNSRNFPLMSLTNINLNSLTKADRWEKYHVKNESIQHTTYSMKYKINKQCLYYADINLYYLCYYIYSIFHLQIYPHTFTLMHIYKSIPCWYSFIWTALNTGIETNLSYKQKAVNLWLLYFCNDIWCRLEESKPVSYIFKLFVFRITQIKRFEIS